MSQALSNEKGLINAAVQTADAAQMFYLLLSMSGENDKDMKFKVLAACGQMRAGLASIIVNLRAKGGSGEISRRVEELANRVFERLNVIRDGAEALVERNVATEGKTGGGFNLIIQQRNAADVTARRRRELEDAEEEVKRLNRAAARRY
jgi:hypothetical protein